MGVPPAAANPAQRGVRARASVDVDGSREAVLQYGPAVQTTARDLATESRPKRAPHPVGFGFAKYQVAFLLCAVSSATCSSPASTSTQRRRRTTATVCAATTLVLAASCLRRLGAFCLLLPLLRCPVPSLSPPTKPSCRCHHSCISRGAESCRSRRRLAPSQRSVPEATSSRSDRRATSCFLSEHDADDEAVRQRQASTPHSAHAGRTEAMPRRTASVGTSRPMGR